MTHSMTPVSPEQVRAAWGNRETDPDAAFATLVRARDERTLTLLAEQCGADKADVRRFILPRQLPGNFVALLRDHLGRKPSARDHVQIAALIRELHAEGFSFGIIGSAVGLSRQRIAVLSGPDADTPPPPPPGTSRRKPPAPCYRQPRSLTKEQLEPLHRSRDRYLSSSPSDRLAAEKELAETARTLALSTRVPLQALYRSLGFSRRLIAEMTDLSHAAA